MGKALARGKLTMKQFFSPTRIGGAFMLPASKSYAHRALIGAALAGNCHVYGVDLSSDLEATIDILTAFGAEITYGTNRSVDVASPCKPGGDAICVSCRSSATTFRLLLPIAAALGKNVTFLGDESLQKRPQDTVFQLLRSHGITLTDHDGTLPITVSGHLTPGDYLIDASLTSQFVSGLLMALPLVSDTTLTLSGAPVSKPYLAMTLSVLDRFGVRVGQVFSDTYSYQIPGGKYHPTDITLPADPSQAAFFAVAAALAAEDDGLTLCGLIPDGGDFRIFDFLEKFGVRTERQGEFVTVYRAEKLIPADLTLTDHPDLLPALAVLAAFAEGESHFSGVGRLRYKESDRLFTTKALLTSLGGHAAYEDDCFTVFGTGSLTGGEVNSFGDHRIAMAAAAASVACSEKVCVSGFECIDKSYPRFFDDFVSVTEPKEERKLTV